MKGEKFNAFNGAGKGKAATEEKENRSSHRTRVCMDFDPKTIELHRQEEVDEYLENIGLNSPLGSRSNSAPRKLSLVCLHQTTEFTCTPRS